MRKMGKQAELVSLTILLIGLAMAYIAYEHTQNYYIGDSQNNITYYLKSSNPDCKLEQISIESSNIVYFNSKENVPENFKFDSICS